MKKSSTKNIRYCVECGIYENVSGAKDKTAIPEPYIPETYSADKYGVTWLVLRGLNTGKKYAVSGRSSAYYLF